MSPIDVISRSRFRWIAAIVGLAACGGTPQTKPTMSVAPPPAPDGTRPKPPGDLDTPPPKKLLSIDWKAVPLANDADALALWATIAPTGDDWEAKLEEVPASAARPLAIALLHGGNFTCAPAKPPTNDCGAPILDVPQPQATSGFVDPCLRRLLALWSLGQLEESDFSAVRDAVKGIVAIAPPESQLVSVALNKIPETDLNARLEILGIAWRAGQKDIVNNSLGGFDESHLTDAVTKQKIDGALEVLSAEGQRPTYLAAVSDEALGSKARTQALAELAALDDKLAPDFKAALVKAAGSKDCAVAAAAAHALDSRGDHRFVPSATTLRPNTPDKMLRALCVLASYELTQNADQPSLLPTYLPAKGLERVTVTYDALADVDTDGDGDPHTQHSVDLVPRDQAVVPEVEDLVRAMRRCTGTTCTSEDREYRFTFKPGGSGLQLTRIELADRPPCQKR
jgi:hypothetical protein